MATFGRGYLVAATLMTAMLLAGGVALAATISCKGSEVCTGTKRADVMTGNEARNLVLSVGGNDGVSGKQKSDLISGGNGDDVIFGGKGADVILPSPGVDRTSGESGDDILVDSHFVEFLEPGTEPARGSSARVGPRLREVAERFFGFELSGVIEASDGDGSFDRFFAGEGDDRLFVDSEPAARDLVRCGPGRDTVTADEEDDIAEDCEKVLQRDIPPRLQVPAPGRSSARGAEDAAQNGLVFGTSDGT